MTVPLLVILAFIVVSAVVGVIGRGRGEMNLERWSVGGRRFGVLLVWLLMAGEIYTTFTFLGASGWAYSRGAPSFYILAYGTLGYIVSFFLLPPIWRMAKRRGLHTQPDFFLARYDSPALAGVVALVGVVSIVPYLQLQLAGLGMIVEIASGGAVLVHRRDRHRLRADVRVRLHERPEGHRLGRDRQGRLDDRRGGRHRLRPAVDVLRRHRPDAARADARSTRRTSRSPAARRRWACGWVISTILLTGLGFYCWPHMFASAFSAKDERTIRRNAVIMPLYQLPILLVFFVGFTALLVIPGLKNPDTALLSLVTRSYPAWFAGFVGGAGAVTAMVPASMLLLVASTLMAKNIYRPLTGRDVGDDKLMRVSRGVHAGHRARRARAGALVAEGTGQAADLRLRRRRAVLPRHRARRLRAARQGAARHGGPGGRRGRGRRA